MPGALWQWVAQANTVYDPNDTQTILPANKEDAVLAGLQIMIAVASTTSLMTVVAWRLKKSCAHTEESNNNLRFFSHPAPGMIITEEEQFTLSHQLTAPTA